MSEFIKNLQKDIDKANVSHQRLSELDDELIKTIAVDRANFMHIAETGVINGTLYIQLKNLLMKVRQLELERKIDRL